MKEPRIPDNEAARLEALKKYRLLDSAAERSFDDLAKLAALIAGCPMAAITLIDEDRQWFKARVGFNEPETERRISFCGHVVGDRRMMMIGDTTKDDRFSDNPLVCGILNVQFYCGFPLINEEGFALGSLCVLDTKPRELTPEQLVGLRQIAHQAIDQIAARLRFIELQEQKLKFDTISAHVSDLIWASSADMLKNEYVSPAFDTIFGRPREELAKDSSKYVSYIHPDDREPVSRAVSREGFDLTYRILRPDGEVRWVHSRAYPVKNESGQHVKMVGVTADITERIQAETVIEQQRVQLVSANRLTSLGEMAAGIAHEINNPLAIIGGLAQILQVEIQRGDCDPELAAGKLEKINQTVSRIAKIINGLKSLARDSTKEEMTDVDLRDVVEDALDLCQTRFANKNIELKITAPETKQFVSAHRFQLAQVLVNLLNNSFDATSGVEKRKISVEVRDQSDFTSLSVVDNGPDIPQDVLAKLMQPFYTTKPPGQGLGIGLSLSKSIVEGFGGRLRFQRANGLTEVSATFPKLKRSEAA